MISVQDVVFTIHRTTITHNISFAIPNIGISALVGENGAGKTTLIRLLSGYLQPSTGTIEILQRQHPDPTISSQMGILSENPPIYDELRVGEYLEFVAHSICTRYSKGKGTCSSIIGIAGCGGQLYFDIVQRISSTRWSRTKL